MNKHARLDEIAALLENSNKAAKAAAEELLGPRKYPVFRDILAGRPTSDVSDRTKNLIAMLPADSKRTMLLAESVMEELTVTFRWLIFKAAYFFARQFSCEKVGRRTSSRRSCSYDGHALLGQVWISFHRAVYGYDNLNYKLVTYIQSVIRREMVRYCFENPVGGLGSKSGEYVELLRASISASEKFWLKHGREPTLDEVYLILHERYPKALDLMGKLTCIMQRVVSITGYEDEDYEHDNSFADIADQSRLDDKTLRRAQGFDDGVEGILDRAEITGVAKAIMMARAADEPLVDIANRLGLSVERVKTVVRQSRRKLRTLAA